MPPRLRRNRRRRTAQINAEAIQLFRDGLDNPHDHHIRIALAVALGRSKFQASPLDQAPRSLIACDSEPVDVALELRAQLLKKIRTSA
jgi:hypothetical protein